MAIQKTNSKKTAKSQPKYEESTTPNMAQECLVCGKLTDKMFSMGKKESVRAYQRNVLTLTSQKRLNPKSQKSKLKPQKRNRPVVLSHAVKRSLRF